MTVRKQAQKAVIRATGTRGFLEWLKVNQPAIYARARPHLARQAGGVLAGLGLTDPSTTAAQTPAPRSWADNLRDVVMAASQAYLTREQLKSQGKILDVQLQRAQAGQPPLDIDLQQYGIQPPQVQVGVAGDTLKTVGLIAGGLGLLWLLGSALKGRRR